MFQPQCGPSSGCGKAVKHMRAIQKNNEKKKFDYKQKIHAYLSYFSTYSPPELRHTYQGISFCMPAPPVSSAMF
jgi:hypothetical protein